MATFIAEAQGNRHPVHRLGSTNAEASIKGWHYGLSLEAIKQSDGRLLYRAYTNGGSSGDSNKDLTVEISTDASGHDRQIVLYYKGELVDLDRALTMGATEYHHILQPYVLDQTFCGVYRTGYLLTVYAATQLTDRSGLCEDCLKVIEEQQTLASVS